MSSSVRAPGKNRPCSRQEVVDLVLARLAALQPLLEERVQVADHLAVRLELLRRRALDRLGQALDEPIERLAAEPLRQRLEPLARGRLHEVVLLERPDPAADVARQRLELVEPAGGRVAEHRAELLVRPRRRRAAWPLVEAALDAGPLVGDDLVELLPNVGQHVAAAVALLELLAAAAKPLAQVVEAGRSGRVGSRPRQPRSISRRSASPRSPSAMTSSASASMISSASSAGIDWVPSQRA